MASTDAKEGIVKYAEQQGWGAIYNIACDFGHFPTRYWGALIPVIHCPEGGIVPKSDKDLPVQLPEDVEFTRVHPLAQPDWVKCACPTCGNLKQKEKRTRWIHLLIHRGISCVMPDATMASKCSIRLRQMTDARISMSGVLNAILHRWPALFYQSNTRFPSR